jgi:hypothetical protein
MLIAVFYRHFLNFVGDKNLSDSASCPAIALHGHINEVVQEQVAFDVE